MDGDDTDARAVEKGPAGRFLRYPEEIGRGAYKTVYKGFDREEGMEVAWCKIRGTKGMSHADRERMFKEVAMLPLLDNKNIINMFGLWRSASGELNIITELFTSGNLREFRHRHRDMDVRDILRKWGRQILLGLDYLHSQDPPIVHRDLKSENILINGHTGDAKIADLGLATVVSHARLAQSVLGTPQFMAPELYDEFYDEMVDIYSFGMVLLELVTLRLPYDECETAAQIYKKVISKRPPAALESVKDSEVRAVIEWCISHDPDHRPTAAQLLQHELFAERRRNHLMITPSGRMYQHREGGGGAAPAAAAPNGPPNGGVVPNGDAFANGGYPGHAAINSHGGGGGDNSFPNIPRGERVHGQRFGVFVEKSVGEHALSVYLIEYRKEGKISRIRFDFDPKADTGLSVAQEMVSALHVSEEDVEEIAARIDLSVTTFLERKHSAMRRSLSGAAPDITTLASGHPRGSVSGSALNTLPLAVPMSAPVSETSSPTLGGPSLRKAALPHSLSAQFENGLEMDSPDERDEESEVESLHGDRAANGSGSGGGGSGGGGDSTASPGGASHKSLSRIHRSSSLVSSVAAPSSCATSGEWASCLPETDGHPVGVRNSTVVNEVPFGIFVRKEHRKRPPCSHTVHGDGGFLFGPGGVMTAVGAAAAAGGEGGSGRVEGAASGAAAGPSGEGGGMTSGGDAGGSGSGSISASSLCSKCEAESPGDTFNIKVCCRDRQGLLFDILLAMRTLELDIQDARVRTEGEVCVDEFLVLTRRPGSLSPDALAASLHDKFGYMILGKDYTPSVSPAVSLTGSGGAAMARMKVTEATPAGPDR
eukprot:jgi/Mesvir1/28227/Mv04776-RA.1